MSGSIAGRYLMRPSASAAKKRARVAVVVDAADPDAMAWHDLAKCVETRVAVADLAQHARKGAQS